MADKLFHNIGSHWLPKRESVEENLSILRLHDSCFSRQANMGYFLGEKNMEKYGYGERVRGTGAGYNEKDDDCSFERRRVKR